MSEHTTDTPVDHTPEIHWLAREARGLSSMPVPPVGSCERAYWQARWDCFTARKVALLAATEGA